MPEPGIKFETDNETYARIVVDMPQTMLMHPDWQNMVWDECLRRAHEAMLMPVGAVMISEPEPIEERRELVEGSPLMAGRAMYVNTPMVRVSADVLLMGGVGT